MQRHAKLLIIIGTIGMMFLHTGGCASKAGDEAAWTGPESPAYDRPLPAGASALRLVTDPDRMPDLAAAWNNRDARLLKAIDESGRWFEAPSSRRAFPFGEHGEITHDRARASVAAMEQLLESATDANAFVNSLLERFDVYESVGCDDAGTVLFTGYYSPVFPASRTRTERFRYPLYKRPADLVTDPVTGEPKGRALAGGGTVPYPTRAQIEQSGMLAGSELAWLEDPLSVYLVHVNGSAKLRLEGDEIMYVGYGGKTDRPYASLRDAMVESGLIPRQNAGLPAIRRAWRENRKAVEALIHRNESYVFFREYDGGTWPAGSLGVPVTAEASLATDKKVYPRAGVVLVDTEAVTFSQGRRRFLTFMLDQDTGGAIKAPGRADIFMGIGPSAEILAGGQRAEGKLYYFFLKDRYVADYARPAAKEAATAAATE